jgi:hypothetical protein
MFRNVPNGRNITKLLICKRNNIDLYLYLYNVLMFKYIYTMGSITKISYCVVLELCKGGLAISFRQSTKKLGTLGTLEHSLIINDLLGTLHGTL